MSALRAQVGASPSLKGTILVVTSNVYASASVSEMLRRAGYRVNLIGEETNWSNTELAHSEIVILIGCNRRWIEQVCSAIKRSAPKLLLMVLGPDDVDARVRLFELGADAYLAEQFAPAELLARITSLTRSQRCTL
jgi:DNA-binding response OmpR family regulator